MQYLKKKTRSARDFYLLLNCMIAWGYYGEPLCELADEWLPVAKRYYS